LPRPCARAVRLRPWRLRRRLRPRRQLRFGKMRRTSFGLRRPAQEPGGLPGSKSGRGQGESKRHGPLFSLREAQLWECGSLLPLSLRRSLLRRCVALVFDLRSSLPQAVVCVSVANSCPGTGDCATITPFVSFSESLQRRSYFFGAGGWPPLGRIFSTSSCGRGITWTATSSPTRRAAAAPASVAALTAPTSPRTITV